MSLEAALVDRARRLYNATVAGQSTPVHGPWFACRLTDAPRAGQDPRRESAPGGMSLLTGVEDEDGAELVLSSADNVEVESDALGTGTWSVSGAPAPLRDLTDIIGYEVPLARPQSRERGFS